MALADSLNRRFVDTDQWLQSQLNMTVAEIVEREEWAGFRARETAALEAVTAPSTVIATGGGIILTEFNRHFMQNNGIVVYLCAPVSVWIQQTASCQEEDFWPATAESLSGGEEFRKCWKNAMRYIAKLRILSSTQQTNPAR